MRLKNTFAVVLVTASPLVLAADENTYVRCSAQCVGTKAHCMNTVGKGVGNGRGSCILSLQRDCESRGCYADIPPGNIKFRPRVKTEKKLEDRGGFTPME